MREKSFFSQEVRFCKNIISYCSYNQVAYKRLEFRFEIIQEYNLNNIKLETMWKTVGFIG